MWNYRQSPMNNDWLAHYGIKGQKKGVRRFQNEDGTLTEEGKIRYGTKENYEEQQNYRNAENEYKKAQSKSRGLLRIFDTPRKIQDRAQDISEKEYKYRKALYRSLHSTINTIELPESERKKAQTLLTKLYDKRHGRQMKELSKSLPGYEHNFDKEGNIVGVSKIGEKNMNMFFKFDPSLDAVYDRSGNLIQRNTQRRKSKWV